jgi:hypothetical protein
VAKVGTSKAGGTISQQAAVRPWLAADAHGNKQTNKQLDQDVLARLRDAVCRKRTELWENQTWMLNHDNARRTYKSTGRREDSDNRIGVHVVTTKVCVTDFSVIQHHNYVCMTCLSTLLYI